MSKISVRILRFWVLTISALSGAAMSLESYSPYAEKTYPTDVYWGDTHLHTNLSVDANQYGNKILNPEQAYRFAKGEAVTAHNGMVARLHRPLDFIAVTDHAFNLGVLTSLESSDAALLKTPSGKRLHNEWKKIQANTDPVLRHKKMNQLLYEKLFPRIGSGKDAIGQDKKAISSDEYTESVWHRVTAIADRHNDPGKFTAFIGYEWSSMTTVDNGGKSAASTIHRNIIFKDGADKTNQIIPYSAFDSMDPEDLWRFLDKYERTTGGEVLAIPHNGNLSSGRMFPLTTDDGSPLTQSYAKMRSRWEPLYETTQMKGDSEAHPALAPTDEFADYETWNGYTEETLSEWKQSEYARPALKLGLEQQFKLGVNPFKFGMIGSTDAHTSLATAEEDNFWGKTTSEEPSPKRMQPSATLWERPWTLAASGYAAVWAEENTRESLFAAMKRKEVYATTGPRITVRFFGGWNYDADEALRPDIAKIGYSKGVPMGSDLTHAPKGKAPSFLIRAVKDPDGANLDRVQVIKGWRETNGALREKIYNVALSDHRKEDQNGNVKPVGNTVDVKEASYTNSIGDPELATVWRDPNFNENELAFYYLRVLEIPTPRWTAYDAKFFGVKDVPDEVPMVTQERAYTSPIWYTPAR